MSVLVDRCLGERPLALRVAAAARARASPGPGGVRASAQASALPPAGTRGQAARASALCPAHHVQPAAGSPRGLGDLLFGRRSCARRTAVASGPLCRTLHHRWLTRGSGGLTPAS